jgi:thioredoxin 1
VNTCNRDERICEAGEMDFDAEVLQSLRPVLVLFWAPWSNPCQKFAPVLDEVAVDCAGRIKIIKINTDDHPTLRRRYEIEFIPTLLCFERGKESMRIVGITSKEIILCQLHLSSCNDQPHVFDFKS